MLDTSIVVMRSKLRAQVGGPSRHAVLQPQPREAWHELSAAPAPLRLPRRTGTACRPPLSDSPGTGMYPNTHRIESCTKSHPKHPKSPLAQANAGLIWAFGAS